MSSTVQTGWIEDDEKYAALGLDVNVDNDIMQAYLGPTLNLVGKGAIPLSAHWREWLGLHSG